MLNPNSRSLYTDALTPPAGMVFDYGVATTYSLDLTLLLGIPLHLVLSTSEDPESLLKDPITLYESLQRVTDRLHIFCQKGNIQVPAANKTLFVLLEKMLFEASAPRGGAFHPKLWVLRFIDPHEEGDVVLRLIVLSRNLTRDQSWDVSLQLEGSPGRRLAKNRQLGKFISSLPEFCDAPVTDTAKDLIQGLADQVRRVDWELPEGFDDVEFHVIGTGRAQPWIPGPCESLVVISPFVGNTALTRLTDTVTKPLALISRAEELDQLDETTRSRFNSVKVLHEAAETEEGQDTMGDLASEIGLHAKVYIYKAGRYTGVVVGSANATDAALVYGNNVEILAELRGNWRLVGRPEHLVDLDQDQGLGSLLIDYMPEEHAVDNQKRTREERLKAARKQLLSAGLELSCSSCEGGWRLQLSAPSTVTLKEIERLRAWPITVRSEQAVEVPAGRLDPQGIAIVVSATESVTSLIAFELDAGEGECLAFVLNLPIAGLPDERDRMILRTIVRNKAGFLRYLLLLLAAEGQMSQSVLDQLISGEQESSAIPHEHPLMDQIPLFEELVRTFSREPARLRRIGRIIKELTADEGGEELLPSGFITLWQTFEAAMEHSPRA